MSYVIMPEADYKDILNATREKTGNSALMLSHQVGANIRRISSGSGEAVGEYNISVSFRDYEGYEMSMTGYYQVNGGPEHYFSTSQLDLWSVANADSQVEIAVINAGSPDVSGSNCSVSWTTEAVMIDDIEYYACIITISNFNGDAFVTYRET